MQITKPTKAEVMRELKDYIFITFGLISYAMGWAAFLIPYQITTGGTTGIGAIIYYSTGFPIQWSYFIINAVLMTFAIKILGIGSRPGLHGMPDRRCHVRRRSGRSVQL